MIGRLAIRCGQEKKGGPRVASRAVSNSLGSRGALLSSTEPRPSSALGIRVSMTAAVVGCTVVSYSLPLAFAQWRQHLTPALPCLEGFSAPFDLKQSLAFV